MKKHTDGEANRRRRGSVAVEAAIFLPLFIVGILTIGCLIRFASVEEGVAHAACDEAHRLAAQAAVNPWPPLAQPPGFAADVEARVVGESGGNIREAEVRPLCYRVPGAAHTDLIGFSTAYSMPLKIPHFFRDEIKGEETVLCRAFVGREDPGGAMPFSEMEDGEGGQTVWVFPRAGEKYHSENCRYIKNEPREVLLDKTIRRCYKPCALCRPDDARDGTLVYIFPKTGEAYHRGSCCAVKKYVIEIGEEEAKAQGYTPCSVCQGNG
ncbi:MAG: hypothetical protein LBR44_07220 [Clostridiales Family XIII bacterium]|jgi:hypothetical protein|nr:hypothetical protein [Clostridiales Family XIII bacterium]